MNTFETLLNDLEMPVIEKKTWLRLYSTLKPEGQVELVKFIKQLVDEQNNK